MAKRIMRWTGDAADNDWATVGNWEADGAAAAGIPITGDDVYILQTSEGITGTLDQSAVVLDLLVIEQSFTGEVGDADNYLEIGALEVRIGENYDVSTPAGSARLKLHLYQTDDAACDVTIYNTATSSTDSNLPPCRLLVEHVDTGADPDATAVLSVLKGRVGLAVNDPNETSDLVSIDTGYITGRDSDARLDIGPGVTFTTLTKTGGNVTLRAAATTAINRAGTLTTRGSGAITTLTCSGGTVNSASSGTVGTLNADGGLVDFTQSTEARTVTTAYRRGEGRIKYDSSVMTFTNPIDSGGAIALSAA